MTLEEMQSTWSEMTDRIQKQEHLTNTLIMEMTQVKFKNKINAISRYESAGAIICFVMAIFILVNINKLDTWYLLTSGLVVTAYLIFIPLIVLKYIKKMKQINLAENTYKQSLLDFIGRRKQFLFWQRFGIFSNFLLMILILPVFSKLSSGKDMFIEKWQCMDLVLCCYGCLLVPFSLWGYKSYKHMTASAENMLKDLQV